MPFIATEAISFEELMPRKDRLCPFKPGKMHRGPVPTSWSTLHRSLLDFPFFSSVFFLARGDEPPQAIRILLFLHHTNNQKLRGRVVGMFSQSRCDGVF